ncbi:PRC-barrel domain-containing protein [Dongia soli]|uniref:PRC-barrel domain-containing protein n=1 Tax=Dongia soli TaxID=600628 RepID=A0ABU5EGH6_9PROT|nr:PRC-barrel domain-containing protein [Dongia soli]MDY0885520.1 PRC-barrel domain-containing protein [Dongia soli]
MATQIPKSEKTLNKDETYSLISADKVQRTSIYNSNGDNLGEVEDLMIDKVSGKVAYAVVSFGGFLGMGAQRRALPWSVLTYDTSREGYVIDAQDDIIRNTPEAQSEETYSDREWGTRLHNHYGVPPYWM